MTARNRWSETSAVDLSIRMDFLHLLANHFLLKLVLAPLIIAAATMVSRRWGESIGGLLVGLPLTSAPVSVFFAIEQGPEFAANAARGAMLGLVPVAVFCAIYARAARKFSWPLTAVFSIGLYLLSVWACSFTSPDLPMTILLVLVCLGLVWFFIGRQPETNHRPAPAWWDLPLRMFVSAALLVFITSAAGILGPKWSGLLSPFPVFTFVMAAFSHSQGGATAARRVIRGVVMGLFAYLAFFLVVSLLVEKINLVAVYGLATLTALGLNGFWLSRILSRQARSSPVR